jgi:hypothetical protein
MAAALPAVIGRPNNVGKPTVCRRTLGHSDAFRGRARSLHGRHVFGWGGKGSGWRHKTVYPGMQQ